MITLKASEDLNWEVITAVAYERARFDIAPELLASVERGREIFNQLIEAGAPCYGVTTGLGKLSTTDLSTEARDAISRNILLARAAAFGEPLPRPVVRAMMMVRLANFLSGQDGVSAELCQFIAARLNDDFDPFVPALGHGFARSLCTIKTQLFFIKT